MSKKTSRCVITVFIAFVTLFFILFITTPDMEFSERENRYLSALPEFSFSSLFSGSFIRDFESYSTDHFPFRDSWITIKAASEVASGKHENNAVILADRDTLLEPIREPGNPDIINKNTSAVNALTAKAGVPVYFALVPNSAQVLSHLLPENSPGIDQLSAIARIYNAVNAPAADIAASLETHASEYVFFRTDHHWTALGAYYAYQALADLMGLEAQPLSDFTPRTVSEDFYGTAYSSSGFSWIEPDTIELYAEEPDGLTVINYTGGSPEAGKLYDESFLSKKDKYSVFYGGNTPLLQIFTGTQDAGKLLILRDSYSDSMSPYFFNSFSEIHMVDLRYYKGSVDEYIKTNGITQVLVIYSLVNFTTDTNIPLMAR